MMKTSGKFSSYLLLFLVVGCLTSLSESSSKMTTAQVSKESNDRNLRGGGGNSGYCCNDLIVAAGLAVGGCCGHETCDSCIVEDDFTCGRERGREECAPPIEFKEPFPLISGDALPNTCFDDITQTSSWCPNAQPEEEEACYNYETGVTGCDGRTCFSCPPPPPISYCVYRLAGSGQCGVECTSILDCDPVADGRNGFVDSLGCGSDREGRINCIATA